MKFSYAYFFFLSNLSPIFANFELVSHQNKKPSRLSRSKPSNIPTPGSTSSPKYSPLLTSIMSSSSFATKFLLIVIAALALSSSAAFQVTPHRSSPGVTRRLTPLSMAADIDENPRLGPTEQLLIAAKERRELREQGYIQELGKTVRKDGLDGVRALVWSVYGASNVVFPALGFVFFAKELLHLAGHSI